MAEQIENFDENSDEDNVVHDDNEDDDNEDDDDGDDDDGDDDNYGDDEQEDDDEILGDDEDERSDDDDGYEEEIIRVDDANAGAEGNNINEQIEDNNAGEAQIQEDENINGNNEAMNNDVNVEEEEEEEEEEREARQETLFQGINTNGMRVPLEANPELRAIDHILLILSKAVRHCNTYEQVIDELRWLKKSYRFINVPTTKAALWETLGRNKENLRYVLYCSKCKDEIGVGQMVERECGCGECGPNRDESNLATFVHIRLAPQLQDVLKIPNIQNVLRYRDNRVKINRTGMEDIYDGAKYKALRNEGNFLSNQNNFSLTLWTDGIQLTKSSPATCYPIIVQLNELTPHSRKQNMFLAGLWVANKHPLMNVILRPVCNELRKLYNNGLSWRPNGEVEVISKFITLLLIADSVARPDCLRMKRFNGMCGCTYCMAVGEMVENTWVYRTAEYVLRSNASIRRDAIDAVTQRRIVNGAKGVTALVRIPEFDLVENVPVDCAHNTYLGVAKRLVIRWLTDVNEAWYIGNPDTVAAIDAKLLTIKPPKRISRKPRSIVFYKLWKATEWRNWLLYYAVPCLDGILPDRYLSHFKKLVKAIYILNCCSVSEEELNTAENLLSEFVDDYQEKYGLKNMVYNVHLLTHLANCVRNWGPLWVFSSLPFESLNRKFTDSIKSPHRRADQVINRFFMKKFVIVAAKSVALADITRTEISRILKISNVHVEGIIEGHYFLGLGGSVIRSPNEEEINVVTAAGKVIIAERDVEFFKKASIHGTEYQIKDNKRRKVCNHIIACGGSTFFIIEKILSYTYDEELVAGVIGKVLRNLGNAYGVSHMQRLAHVEEKRFIEYSEIRSPGFMIPISENVAAVPLANIWETD